MPCFGALEAGGTKMVCAIGNEDGKIPERISLPTSSVLRASTLAQAQISFPSLS